ncbi:MAG: delta-60 repeat domain-containing protein [Rudaea sp.]
MRAAHRFHRFLAWTFVIVSLAANCAPTTTTDGSPDPTFGDNGRVYLGWDVDSGVTAIDSAIAVLAPADGSVILVGNGTDAGASYGSFNAICIAKLTAAGTFDASFGDIATPGQTKIHGSGSTNYQINATSAALQPDGKIVIAGSVYYGSGKQEAAVWRLNANGTPDTGFGFLGASFIDRGLSNQFDSANAVLVVQGTNTALDGTIVVAGSQDFDPSLVIAQAWIVQLDSFGLQLSNGSNTFNWAACEDGYHDQTFSAIRLAVRADTGAIQYFLAGNCAPRGGGSSPYNFPFLAAIDSTLNLVASFGNNDNGISTVADHDTSGNIMLASSSTITSLDVDAGGTRIVYAGYYYDGTYSHTYAYAGALDAHTGQFDQRWGYAGAGDAGFIGGGTSAAWGVLFDYTRGGYASAIVGGADACLPAAVCLLAQGQSFAAKKLGEGWTVPFCYTTGECAYQYTGDAIQGANAMAYTQGAKVLLAGYVQIGSRYDFAVMRLQGGDEVFLDGFGTPTQGFR